MRISSTYGAYQNFNANAASRTQKRDSKEIGRRDAFILSVQAEDYQQVRKALPHIPDIRTDRVNAIRARIASGSYTVTSEEIADKILNDIDQFR